MNSHATAATAAPPDEEPTAQQRRHEARQMYRDSVAAELPMTAKALGAAFGRSARWGRDRIAEVRAQHGRRSGMPPVADAAAAPVDAAIAAAATGLESQPTEVRPSPAEPAGMPPVEAGMPPAAPAQPRRPVRTWPVLLLAAPAFVSIWGGWVGLGELTGFGEINLLPGIAPAGGWATINSAITLPIGVETYAAYALRAWLSGDRVPRRARRFARWSAIGSLALGFLGQVAYHQLAAAHVDRAPWWVTTLVSGLPVAVLGMGAALAHLLHADGSDG